MNEVRGELGAILRLAGVRAARRALVVLPGLEMPNAPEMFPRRSLSESRWMRGWVCWCWLQKQSPPRLLVAGCK